MRHTVSAASKDEKQSLPRDFEATTRRFSIGLQVTAILLCLIAWMAAPSHYSYYYYTWPLIALTVALCVTITLASLNSMLAIMSIVNVWLIAAMFALTLTPSPNSSLWSFSLCMSFSLILAPLFLKFYEYGLAAGGVHVIFGGGEFPVAIIPGEFYWSALTNAAVPSIGLALNIFFARLHKLNFKSRIDLVNLAYRDPLTGVGNRRMLIEAMEDLCNTRYDADRYFMMIDVDNFKSVNDEFGHEKGDAVLIEIARKLESVFGVDCIARMGGEEFGVLLAYGGADRASKLASSFIEQVKQIRAGGRPVTVSIGITGTASTPTDMMRLADEALYDAKRSGKDRASIARPLSAA